MDTQLAFLMGKMARNEPSMVFDWIEAAKLIRDHQPRVASAGLAGDWEWTGGTIYENGAPVLAEDTYTYLASTWATPELSLDGDCIDCWVYASETPGWDASTYWPDIAVAILTAVDAHEVRELTAGPEPRGTGWCAPSP